MRILGVALIALGITVFIMFATLGTIRKENTPFGLAILIFLIVFITFFIVITCIYCGIVILVQNI